jgi:hypothetical protein
VTKQQARERSVHPNGRTHDPDVRPATLVDQIPPMPPERRPERYAFNFWGDQIIRLKKLKQVLNFMGGPDERKEIALSDLVRDAVDEYLDKRIEQIKQSIRTDG